MHIASRPRAASQVAACIALAGLAAGCGAHGTHRAAAAQPLPVPKLTRSHPCPGVRGFACASLIVPLDHAGQAPGKLTLQVAVEDVRRAPHGVLLFLTGGPGQPGVRFIPRIRRRLHAALSGYRFVMFDQRGTGAGAIRCPALQSAAGASDLVAPPPGGIDACVRILGEARRFFTTPETLADIDQLRRALGAPRLTLDGVSYGTFVAERYALAYPNRVARLVLDSVVPQQGVDPLNLASLQGTARVLRSACATQRCPWDPGADIATVVRGRHNGPELLNALVAESIVFPDFPGVLGALHDAAHGRLGALDALFSGVRTGEAVPASFLSQGLHDATLCLDLAPPWDPATSTPERAAALARRATLLPVSAVYPFDRVTAKDNGAAQTCVRWPATRLPAVPAGNPSALLPRVPVLVLAGERDLSTPLAWARQEALSVREGQLVVVAGAGHDVQLRGPPAARRLLTRFLAG